MVSADLQSEGDAIHCEDDSARQFRGLRLFLPINLLLLQIEVGLIFSASPRSERWPRGSRNRCLRIFWTVPVPRVLEIDVRGKFFLNVEIVMFLSFRTALLYQGKVLQRHARHTLLLSLGRDNDGTVDEEPVCVLRLIGLCPHHLQNFRDPSDVSVS